MEELYDDFMKKSKNKNVDSYLLYLEGKNYYKDKDDNMTLVNALKSSYLT